MHVRVFVDFLLKRLSSLEGSNWSRGSVGRSGLQYLGLRPLSGVSKVSKNNTHHVVVPSVILHLQTMF
jgi:hypothetical protein